MSENLDSHFKDEIVPGRGERMLHFFNNAREGMIFHIDGMITDINPALLNISGYSSKDLIGTSVFRWIPERYHQLVRSRIGNNSEEEYEITVYHRSGEEIPVFLRPIHALIGGRKERLVTVQEISALKKAENDKRKVEARIDALSNLDPLTRLPNRYLFMRRLVEMCEHHDPKHHNFAVVHIAIERMKMINDLLGSDAGDQLVSQWVQRLRHKLRSNSLHFLSRFSGIRFAIALPYIDDRRSVFRLLENLRAEVDAAYTINGHPIEAVGSTYGVSFFPEDGTNADVLVSRAEIASRHARRLGGGQIRSFSSEMDVPSLENFRLETRLKGALERDELMLYYQPKVNALSEQVIGYEALIRWNDPEHEIVSPDDFIPIAEQTGEILPIGEWAIWCACEHLSVLSQSPGPTPRISVNISGLQFRQRNLVENITQALTLFQIKPELLELELTESALMADVEGSIATLAKLKELGVHISIDDFGTGYSSLSYLKRLPIDTLKIDRSFIIDITSNEQDKNITRAIIALARSLGLETVAEGVESREQLNELRRLGCDHIQGFLFGIPTTFEQTRRNHCFR